MLFQPSFASRGSRFTLPALHIQQLFPLRPFLPSQLWPFLPPPRLRQLGRGPVDKSLIEVQLMPLSYDANVGGPSSSLASVCRSGVSCSDVPQRRSEGAEEAGGPGCRLGFWNEPPVLFRPLGGVKDDHAHATGPQLWPR